MVFLMVFVAGSKAESSHAMRGKLMPTWYQSGCDTQAISANVWY